MAFPLLIMHSILGYFDRTEGLSRNHASKLCQDVFENELAYSVRPILNSYKDTGLFGVYMSGPDVKLDDLVWTVMNNLVRLVHTVSEQEVERAKLSLKAGMLGELDGHAAVADDIGRQLLVYGRRMTPAEIYARIDAVSLDKDHACAAVGGIHGMPDYGFIRRHSYWLRY
jgi:processing peptidase subunit beta